LVAEFLRNKIVASGGSIGFAEFMQHSLYAPGLGYYSAGSTKFGAGGDFVTAPELSPLFGRVLGNQCASLLDRIPGGNLLELGAGSAALAIWLIQKLADADALPQKYLILEPSADLQARQQQRIAAEIPRFANRVEWIAGWPVELDGVVIANEVADAIPVARFVMRNGMVRELRVAVTDQAFHWREQDAAPVLREAVRQIESNLGATLPDGYVSEACLALPAWLGDLARCIRHGFVFLFDYGVSRREYYAGERNGGWLRCHFRHRAHNDPLILPGIQDLTAWVNFTAVAEAATANGMDIAGYVTQAHFLLHGGLQDELWHMPGLPATEQFELSRQVKLLTLPGEMGENFKCMGLSKGVSPAPSVFAQSDRAHAL
jgi:SAM-dependent MidA family methyltransferase